MHPSTQVGETSVHVGWRAPAPNSTGGSAITGYNLYMYPGASLNTVSDMDPVKQEVQRVIVTSNAPQAVWKSNLQPDFNVSVCDSFDAISSALLRELDESNRSVRKSADSTSI